MVMLVGNRYQMVAGLTALWFACCVNSPAQVTTAGINGVITDSQGLAVPAVRLLVVNESTGQKFDTVTNETGNYFVRSLPVGHYAVSVEKAGFKGYKQSGIELTSNQLARIDVQLVVGAVTEAVSVAAQMSPVDVSTATLGVLVDTKRLEDLPLNGRDVLALTALNPGVTSVVLRETPSIDQQDISVNGQRGASTNVMLDGAAMFFAHRGGGLAQPPPDAVQEVKIVTSGQSAEFKRGSSAVSLITRGGTNEFHGSLWDYFRNDTLDARSFFASQVSRLRYNQFGGAAGGPIVRSKAFFFFAFQGLQNYTQSLVSSAFPPTAQERSGDLSRTLGASPVDPLTGQLFPNSLIPRSRMDPVALKLLDMIPLPNQPTGTYVTQISAPMTDRNYMGRVDYDFTPGDRTTFRYYIDNRGAYDPFSGSNVDGYGGANLGVRPQNWNLNHTHTFTPALLLNMRASVTRFSYHLAEAQNAGETLATLGSKFITGGGPGALPDMSVSGRFIADTSQQIGTSLSEERETNADLSWFRGRHELKFGADFMWVRFFYHVADKSYGLFTFDGTFTKNALADFLLGQASNMQQQQFRNNDIRYYTPGFYVQDRWRATPRLTINAGLRWDIYSPWRQRYTPAAAFVPGAHSQLIPSAPTGLIYDTDPGFPLQMRAFNLGPRVGFAYDVFGNGKTSVRGGYGISYSSLIGQITAQNSPPFAIDVNTSNVGPLSDPQRNIVVTYGTPVNLNNPVFPPSLNPRGSWAGKIVVPYAQDINLTAEQRVTSAMLLQLSYVATLGRHEPTMQEQNPAVYIPGASTATNIDQRRIYAPGFTSIRGWATDSDPSYNALQVVLSQHSARGVSYSIAYAFSKAIDESGRGDAADGWWRQDPSNRRGSRGLGDYDIQNRLVASWVWELPVLRGQHNMAERTLGGWRLSGIATIQDGTPFTVISGKDNSMSGVAEDRPNIIGDPRLATNRPLQQELMQYFNGSAFVANGPGQYGNAGRNILIGPGTADFDLSLGKSFAFSERKRIEFRWDAFNTLNTPKFGQPASSLASPATLGRITTAGPGRVMQLALRFAF
jgi:hypothetical protein